MTRVLVNPGHTLSVAGVPHVAGQIVDVDPSQVARLTAEGAVSDPYKGVLPTPAQAELAAFQAAPPVKPEGDGGDVSTPARRSRARVVPSATAPVDPSPVTPPVVPPDPNNGVNGEGGDSGEADEDEGDGEGDDAGGQGGVDDAVKDLLS